MCTRIMNLGCFCVILLDVLMFSPCVTNTVKHGFVGLAGGEGCLSTSAKLVPWPVFQSPEQRTGPNEPART
jgi:hypothetical protein